ncbi:MAG: glycosyltransferase family 9 protein [Stenotrophobium sp.]
MATFRDKIVGAKKVLLINPRGLGDVIHSLPVAAMLRKYLPDACIDFLASDHSKELFNIIPCVDVVLTVPSYPRPKSKTELYGRRIKVAWRIATSGYDAIVNLKPLDSTAALICMSLARNKLATRDLYTKTKFRWMYSDIVDNCWQNQSCYRFQLDSMATAGFDTSECNLGPELVDLSEIQLPPSIIRPYFHISLFASKESRQLPAVEAKALIMGLLERYPSHQLVISCSSVKRELGEIEEYLPKGSSERIKIFAGTLDTSQLAGVIARSDAHIGPDTGSVHLAWLVGAKSVSWYLNHESLMAWVPYGPQHRVLLSTREQARIGDLEGDPRRIQAIKASYVLEELDTLLTNPLPPKAAWPGSDHIGFRYIG